MSLAGFTTDKLSLLHGDSLKILPELDAESIDSIVTDPPYFLTSNSGNGFMGKAWDSLSPELAVVEAFFRSARIVSSGGKEFTVVQNAPISVSKNERKQKNLGSNVQFAEPNSKDINHNKNLNMFSVQEYAITKEDALVLCEGLLPSHINDLQKKFEQNPSASFVLKSFIPEARSLGLSNIARIVVGILYGDPGWLENSIHSGNMEDHERHLTEDPIGTLSEKKSTKEIIGNAAVVENIMQEKESNAITSSHGKFQKIIDQIISLPFVRHAIRESMKSQSFIPALSRIFHYRWAKNVFRIIKPGGHALVFGGTRTWGGLIVALEEAGWEVRDTFCWLYGSGFPKSLDVGKAIDKRGGASVDFSKFREAVLYALDLQGKSRKDLEKKLGNYMLSHYLTAGAQPAIPSRKDYLIIRNYLLMDDTFDPLFLEEAEREVVGHKDPGLDKGSGSSVSFDGSKGRDETGKVPITISSTDEAKRWEGWGTALKPGYEPIFLVRKPLSEPTVAANVLRHGTGGINIDGCRIAGSEPHHNYGRTSGEKSFVGKSDVPANTPSGGRWPSNVILSHNSDCVFMGTKKGPGYAINKFTDGAKPFGGGAGHPYKSEERDEVVEIWECSEGCAVSLLDAQSGESERISRFFYCAKPSVAEKTEGVDKEVQGHPTVKSVELMRHLCRLVTPKGGTVLDPFMGSGSTAIGAYKEGFAFIGIEKDLEYFQIAEARLRSVTAQQRLFV